MYFQRPRSTVIWIFDYQVSTSLAGCFFLVGPSTLAKQVPLNHKIGGVCNVQKKATNLVMFQTPQKRGIRRKPWPSLVDSDLSISISIIFQQYLVTFGILKKDCHDWLVATQRFFIFIPILGEMIQFDVCIFFRWVGSTTTYLDVPLEVSKWLVSGL